MDFTYEIVNRSVIITGMRQQEQEIIPTDIHIPSEIEGMPVTIIGRRAFSHCNCVSVDLPETVEEIKDYAFSECRSLNRIELPHKVKQIGNHAFYNCRHLETIKLPGGITTIGDGALKNCTQLKLITIVINKNKNVTLKNCIPDLSGDITIEMMYRSLEGDTEETKAKVFFPKDNVILSDFSTRLYMDVQYGVGNHYRQAIGLEGLDYKQYDALFSRAYGELGKDLLITIAMNRLRYPYQLHEVEREAYRSYIVEHLKTVLTQVIKEERVEELQYLMKEGYIHEGNVELALELAYEMNKIECIGHLLELKHTWSDRRNIAFEL